MIKLKTTTMPAGFKESFYGGSATGGGIELWWLGQAGFALRSRRYRMLLDPYLSDHLAVKYKGREFPHKRMMAAPVMPEDLHDIDLVLCSHAHSDHMDPGSLPIIAAGSPDCRFIVPRAEQKIALERGIPPGSLIAVNAGERVAPHNDLRIDIIPSAHEEIQTDEDGGHRYLGYIITVDDITVYHSGDCVPFEGLKESLKTARIDVALLPVNGRDTYRKSKNILGNFTFREAAGLCIDAGIPVMIAHHYGMFDFNSVRIQELAAQRRDVASELQVVLPEAGVVYALNK